MGSKDQYRQNKASKWIYRIVIMNEKQEKQGAAVKTDSYDENKYAVLSIWLMW